MFKTIKRVILSSLAILGISFFLCTVLFLNPNLSYAHQTKIDQVTIFHNADLEEGTQAVIFNALNRIKRSELYDENLEIQLCLNDDKLYPNLQFLVGPNALAFATLNKTIVKNCDVKFNENVAETRWAINNHEHRKFDLTYLLAHEFTHNLQWNSDYRSLDPRVVINWKLEGHADYIGRGYQHDGQLRSRINRYLIEETKEHNGLPVIELEDGTKQILSYFKYSLVVQYLIEEKKLNFDQVYNLEPSIDDPYQEMLKWSKAD